MLQFPDHIMTMQELKEYKSLSKELFAGASFIEYDHQDPRHVRHNELSGKYAKLRTWTLRQLSIRSCPEKEVCTYSRSCSGNCI